MLAGVLLVAFLIGVSLQGGFNGLYPLAAQIYPTSKRSAGVGRAMGVGRGGAVVGPLLGGYLLTAALGVSDIGRGDGVGAAAEGAAVWRRSTPSVRADVLTKAVIEKLDAIQWPAGYRYDVAGEAESRAESFAGFGAAIMITTFGILAVLVLEFGSFKSTLIVATVIPLGVMGGLLALFFSGYSMSFSAIIGFIALIGIEIKNSILLVDFTNQLRREGMELNRAIEQAGEVRFLPILLTSLTAIGGLLPLALQGSGLYSPLAWVIIGGLVSSTLIGRLVTPVMYKLLPPVIAVAPQTAPQTLTA